MFGSFLGNGGGATGRDVVAALVGVAAAAAAMRYTDVGARAAIKLAIAHDKANPSSTAVEDALDKEGFALVSRQPAPGPAAPAFPAPASRDQAMTHRIRTRAGSILTASSLAV